VGRQPVLAEWAGDERDRIFYAIGIPRGHSDAKCNPVDSIVPEEHHEAGRLDRRLRVAARKVVRGGLKYRL
jgi:hypothetical protein